MTTAIVVTARLPSDVLSDDVEANVLNSFAKYHIAIGFDHIFLFLDGSQEEQPFLKYLTSRYSSNQLSIYFKDDHLSKLYLQCQLYDQLEECIENEVQARQQLNCEIALQECLCLGYHWLVHLDIDELFYIQSRDIRPHFQTMENMQVGQMTYVNHEGIAHSENISDYFREIFLFRRHHFCIPLTSNARNSMNFWKNRTSHGQYMLAYDNGKSAVRVIQGVLPAGVHRWKLPLGSKLKSFSGFADPRNLQLDQLLPCEDPCILHYPNCGFQWFQDKYMTLGQFPNSWFNGKLPIEPCFHTDARDVTVSKKHDLIQRFYRQQVLFEPESNEEELQRQLSAGVCMKLTSPSQILSGNTILVHENNNSPQITPQTPTPDSEKGNPLGEYTYEKAWMISSIVQEYLQPSIPKQHSASNPSSMTK